MSLNKAQHKVHFSWHPMQDWKSTSWQGQGRWQLREAGWVEVQFLSYAVALPDRRREKKPLRVALKGAGLPLLVVVVVEWALNHTWYWALKLERPLSTARRNGASKPTLHHRNLCRNKSVTAEIKELMAPGNDQQRSWFQILLNQQRKTFFFFTLVWLSLFMNYLLCLCNQIEP